jgi:hypothetical protein
MVELKKISSDAVAASLKMAKNYRLLNEPDEAESICLDILEVEPDNQEALITLLLALTDKFSDELASAFPRAQEIVQKLASQYCKSYYTGIVYERRAKAHLKQPGPMAGLIAHEWFSKALVAFGHAIDSCDPHNQDAVLRWNSCARIVNENPNVKPGDEDANPEMLLDSFETPH